MPVLHVPSPSLHMVTKHTIGTHALDEGKGLLPSLSNILPCQLMEAHGYVFIFFIVVVQHLESAVVEV